MSSDETTIAETPTDHSRDTTRPQLRLHHIFALTAVAAVLLAIQGQLPDYWANTGFEPPRWVITSMMAWLVINALIVAVAVTAVAYGIAWQRMGLTFFDQPGHWLLVEIAATGLFGMVPAIAYRWVFTSFQGGNFDESSMWIMWVLTGYSMIFIMFVPLALNIYFGLRKCHDTRWSLVFYFKAAARVLMGIGDLLVLPFTVNAAWRDRREQIPRDGGHWCGVFVQCALSGLTIAGTLLSFANMYFMLMRR
jgi:hypothetical protein